MEEKSLWGFGKASSVIFIYLQITWHESFKCLKDHHMVLLQCLHFDHANQSFCDLQTHLLTPHWFRFNFPLMTLKILCDNSPTTTCQNQPSRWLSGNCWKKLWLRNINSNYRLILRFTVPQSLRSDLFLSSFPSSETYAHHPFRYHQHFTVEMEM